MFGGVRCGVRYGGHVWVFGEWREGGRGREECRESDPAIYICNLNI